MPGAECQPIQRGAVGEPSGRPFEGHARAAKHVVEALVLQQHLVGIRDAGLRFAAALAALAPGLEQVGEIVAEADRELDRDRLIGVILHRNALVGARLPQKRGADDVQRVFRQHDAIVVIDVGIGEIHAECGIVVTNARAEQQRRHALHPQLEIG